MKRNSFVAMICLSAVLALAGCTSNEPDNTLPPETNNPESSNKPSPDVMPSSNKSAIEGYINLIGSDDSAVIGLLGEGKKTDLDGAVISREYHTDLFGKTLPLTVAFDQGKVIEVSLYPEEGTYGDWKSSIQNSLGDPSESSNIDKEEGSDAISDTWALTNGGIRLQSAYGTLFMSIFMDSAQ